MKVRLYGNCQVTMLEHLFREVKSDWSVISREVHTFDVNSKQAFDDYAAEVRDADVIVIQPISKGYRGVDYFRKDWIDANKRSGAKVLVFPSIYFRGYTINSFELTADEHITAYHDVHIADMFVNGVSPSECFERISNPSFFTDTFVLTEVLRSFNQLVLREHVADVDVKASPFIAPHLQHNIVFHTFNHPARGIMVGVANQLLEAMGIEERAAIAGVDHLSVTRMMPYVSAALHMELPAAATPELGHVTLPHQAPEPLGSFIEASYESYRRSGPEKVRGSIDSHGEARPYLDRFQASLEPGQPRFNYMPFVKGLYRQLLSRQASIPEIVYWDGVFSDVGPSEAFKLFSASPEFQSLHARL